jgi:hypothetical protein
VLYLLYLVEDEPVDLLVAGDDNFLLGAYHYDDVPVPGDDVRLGDLGNLHEFVDYIFFVPGNDFDKDEGLLEDRQHIWPVWTAFKNSWPFKHAV